MDGESNSSAMRSRGGGEDSEICVGIPDAIARDNLATWVVPDCNSATLPTGGGASTLSRLNFRAGKARAEGQGFLEASVWPVDTA